MINKKILLLSLADENNWNFDKNIYRPLKFVFSKVIRYQDYRKRLNEIGIKQLQKEIIDLVRSERPHYILVPASSYEILEETFQAFHAEGSIIFGWFFDDSVRFDNYSKWWIPYIDYFLTSNKDSVQKYNDLGAKSIYVPIACNHQIYIKKNVEFSYNISFVGRNIANREKFITEIKNNNIQVHTFGFSSNEIISFEEMINIFSGSKINLNFTGSYRNPKIKQLKARIFEVTMCGGFLLTEYVNGIEEFFEIDKEIVCFKTVDEAVDKVKYYLRHEKERIKIARAGWERAHKDHTWQKRLSDIFEKIEKDITVHGGSNILPSDFKMPPKIIKMPSSYHYKWAVIWLSRKNPKLCKDEIRISLKYNPYNLNAKMLLAISQLPIVIQLGLINSIEKMKIVLKKLRSKMPKMPMNLCTIFLIESSIYHIS